MVQLIVGKKGTGKTKRLRESAIERATKTKGNIVCVEKGNALSFDLEHQIRLVDIEEFAIEGPHEYFGFLAGLLAGNYDITDIFCDATYTIICGPTERNPGVLEDFIHRVDKLGKQHECTITFSVSADESDIPESLKKLII